MRPNLLDPGIFTIGHSNHDTAHFVSLLEQHGIAVVADVRAAPYSRYCPQFNRENLAASLRARNYQYLYLGDQLSARRSEPDSLLDGKPRYNRIPTFPAFQHGLAQARQESATRRIAMMCAEKDPLDCHRLILICRELRHEKPMVRHIMADGSIQTQAEVEQRLLELVGLKDGGLFDDAEQRIRQAYEIRAEKFGYHVREFR